MLNMQKNPTSAKDGEEQCFPEASSGVSTCIECREVFEKPVLATVSSNGYSKTYYACPRCLAKVGDTEPMEDEEGEELHTEVKNETEGGEGVTRCEHFLGFLKNRPRDMAIPDECFTCNKMIECLTK